jgi:UDP-glucuronate 4-epimerase
VLRFFNVYGPQGRPDMMPWQWSQKISRGEEITLFNGGHLKRDWTYIDDIVRGFVLALDANLEWEIFNLGCGVP